ncbi:hypothetical protein B7P43_G12669, partial [Cryptotermes secundus]
FYSNTMKRDRFLHILRFLHFAGNNTETDRNANSYDRLWKIRTIFDTLNDAYEKYYNPSEHFAIDEIIVKFKGRVVFRQYIPKKHKRFGIKIFYVDKADRMANRYSISRRTWKWTNKLFFQLLDLTILNSFILLSCCGAKLSHREFRLALVRNMVEHAARGPPRTQWSRGRPPAVSSTISRLEQASRHHWPTFSKTRLRCHVCSSRGKRSNIRTKCMKCDRWTLHFQMFPTVPHEGNIQLDDAGGKTVYL